MDSGFRDFMRGYTIVELMVTLVIVTCLAATVGIFVVKLLTLQEQDREEAYIREKLVDICGMFADNLSLGYSISNRIDQTYAGFNVNYRKETGGVSFETGRVSRVTQLTSFERPTSNFVQARVCKTLDMNIHADLGISMSKTLSNEFRGEDVPLLTARELKINDNLVSLSYRIDPLTEEGESAALWQLQVRADYVVRNDKDVLEPMNAVAKRVVRLWNRE